jgi:hypothetical protein
MSSMSESSPAIHTMPAARGLIPPVKIPIPVTMLLPPCVVISASETPLASTRWRMIETAWASCSLVGPEEAPSSCGARMICVPPSRSSASFGLHEPLLNATLAALPPARIGNGRPRVSA